MRFLRVSADPIIRQLYLIESQLGFWRVCSIGIDPLTLMNLHSGSLGDLIMLLDFEALGGFLLVARARLFAYSKS